MAVFELAFRLQRNDSSGLRILEILLVPCPAGLQHVRKAPAEWGFQGLLERRIFKRASLSTGLLKMHTTD
jgi:hypothetical protein